MDLESSIAGCADAHARLVRAVQHLGEGDVRAPSQLPDWSVAHLLTHIARNADSVLRRLDGARRGEVVDQYPGGRDGRAAEIAAGADRPASELIDDVVTTAAAVDAAFAVFPADAWDRLGRTVDGSELPVSQLPFGRWREVDVHLVDLGIGLTPAGWPPALAEAWLPELLSKLADRTDPVELLAWVLRRGDAPDLGPW